MACSSGGCGEFDGGCSDCDGGPPPRLGGPLDGLRQLKRRMVCGSGCADTYYGEWRSTPPDANDPCCGDEFVGGAVPCRPFNWRPGSLLSGLYGVRFCDDCGESFDDCGCDGYDSYGGGSIVDNAISNGTIRAPSSCGCGSCASSAHASTQRMAKQPMPPQDVRTAQRPVSGRTPSGRTYTTR